MFIKNKLSLKYFDIFLTIIYFILLVVGLLAVYSASYSPAEGVSSLYIRQFYWLILGIITYLLFSIINYRFLIQYIYILYILGVLLLMYVLLTGYISMGAQRWIDFGPFRMQPSEFFKIIWIIMLGRLFSDFNKEKLGIIKIVIKSLLLLPPFLLVFLQPDLGTAGIFVLIWGVVLLFRGIKLRTLITLILLSIMLLILVWGNLHDYQRARVITFINPTSDPFGSGYHIIQSKVAIGSGGIFGKGFLKGTQSQLNFLPEKHTDFVFSVICEEFGFIGGGILIVIFLILFYRIIQIALITKEVNAKILCVSIMSLIFLQTFINMAMTVGLMPVVGIPMPFISYGGSAMITFSSLMGVINSISIRRFNRL
jgi:rod shape determining protein RodA